MAKNYDLGISEKGLADLHKLLNALLADQFVLYTQTRNFHWHITGLQFKPLHTYFEELYTAGDTAIDSIAERIRSLNGKAAATLQEYLSLTQLKEVSSAQNLSASEMLNTLLQNHLTLVRSLRKGVEVATELSDAGTADFLTGLLEEHEKTAWMLQAHLQ